MEGTGRRLILGTFTTGLSPGRIEENREEPGDTASPGRQMVTKIESFYGNKLLDNFVLFRVQARDGDEALFSYFERCQ